MNFLDTIAYLDMLSLWPKSRGLGEAVISADRARRFDTL